MRPVITCLVLGLMMVRTAGAQGTLTGHVRGPSGSGIASAEVRIAGGRVVAITGADGTFRVERMAAGVVILTARRIGFQPGSKEVTVIEGGTVEVIITLDIAVQQLEQVRVTERREPFDARLAGFRQRMQKHTGVFITRDRIDASASSTFSDLLRGIAGIRLVQPRSGIRNSVRFRGADCPPLVFVDGFPASAGEFDIDNIDPATVEGVEIYMSMLTVPPELSGPRGLEHCGVIAIWSRPFRPAPRVSKAVSQAELERMVESASVFTAEEVDSAASLVPGSFAPVYPDSLWRTGTDGEVVVRFVVDSAGRVEMPYFGIVSASRVEFGESVREALTRAVFFPATKGGRRVRQLVVLPVRFERPKSPGGGRGRFQSIKGDSIPFPN